MRIQKRGSIARKDAPNGLRACKSPRPAFNVGPLVSLGDEGLQRRDPLTPK